jgi:Bacterial protein of unknown function (DUF899)
VPVEKEYRFDTDGGEKSLAELFDGRSQLLVYHFMFGPSYQAGCPVNSSIADTVDGVLPHLHARDATFLLVSQAPLEKLQPYKRRMGWSLPWVSTAHTDFNFDLGFSFTEDQAREAVAQMRPPGLETFETSSGTETGLPPIVEQNARATGTDVVGYLRAPRRGRLPRVLDDLAGIGVRDGLLPDPRPRTERPQRGRGLAALDPPARRVLIRLATSEPEHAGDGKVAFRSRAAGSHGWDVLVAVQDVVGPRRRFDSSRRSEVTRWALPGGAGKGPLPSFRQTLTGLPWSRTRR